MPQLHDGAAEDAESVDVSEPVRDDEVPGAEGGQVARPAPPEDRDESFRFGERRLLVVGDEPGDLRLRSFRAELSRDGERALGDADARTEHPAVIVARHEPCDDDRDQVLGEREELLKVSPRESEVAVTHPLHCSRSG